MDQPPVELAKMSPLNECENNQNDSNQQPPSNGGYRPNDIRLWMNWTTRDQIMASINQFTAVLSGKSVSSDCKNKMTRRINNAITTLIGLQSGQANSNMQIDRTRVASPKKRMKLKHTTKKSEQTPGFEISFNLRTKLTDLLIANLNTAILKDEMDAVSSETKSELIKRNNNMNHQLLSLPVKVIDVGGESQTTTDERPLAKENVVFCFVGYSSQEKLTFAKKLAEIGIKVDLDGHEYDYLITCEDKLTKCAALFVAIAKGRWVCHPEFYRQTLSLGAPPDPEQFEWGSNEQYLHQLEPRYVPLARSCRYWRLKVAETGQFAFHNQSHVIVSVGAENYASILSNGGGLVVSTVELASKSKESYKNALTKLFEMLKDGTLFAEYVLINVKRKDCPRLCDLGPIQRIEEELKVKCLAIDYLSLFLVEANKLNINNLLLNPKN